MHAGGQAVVGTVEAQGETVSSQFGGYLIGSRACKLTQTRRRSIWGQFSFSCDLQH